MINIIEKKNIVTGKIIPSVSKKPWSNGHRSDVLFFYAFEDDLAELYNDVFDFMLVWSQTTLSGHRIVNLQFKHL